jgi:hypothetical protein
MRRRPERHPRPRWEESSARARAARLGLGLYAVICLLALAAQARAAGGVAEIASNGPLTRIIVTGDLNCQVAHRDDSRLEFFGDELGACGTFMAAAGTLHGPELVPSGSFGAFSPWTPVTQSGVTGSGSRTDPLRVQTVVSAAGTQLRLEQTDSYVVGEEAYRTDIRITNDGGSDLQVIVYRAGDCFLQNSDQGYGRVDDGGPACVISEAANARIEQWVPLTPGSRYMEAGFGEVWQQIAAQLPFPNTCRCDVSLDNGAGLSWEVTVPGRGSVSVAHTTFFSPEGRRSTTPLRASVPGPAEISLDPVILATSVAVAAGVVVLVPFPAALFNSTLETHYDEVVRSRRRVTGWLRRVAGGLLAQGPQATRRFAAPVSGAAGSSANTAAGASLWTTWRGIGLMLLLSALLYGLLDPTLGFDVESLGTLLGLAVGLVIVLGAYAVPLFVLSRRGGFRLTAEALPGTIAIAIISVIISRVADFQPGYLYGVVIGFGFTRELSKMEEGRFEAVATGTAFAFAVIAWLLLPVIRDPALAGEQALVASALETAFITVVVAGVEATMFGMLPLAFLPGERVRAWNQRVWMVLIGLGSFAFFHILVNPVAGYLADTTQSDLTTVIWLLVLFGGGSILFWAYFRFRPSAPSGATADGADATPAAPDGQPEMRPPAAPPAPEALPGSPEEAPRSPDESIAG